MKCFSINNIGDVIIKNNKILMTSDNELMQQKIQKILSTNKGEWFANSDEGISFQNILKKNVTEEEIKSEILGGLMQIDSSFILTDFSMELDPKTRILKVTFSATNSDGETVEVNTTI